MAVDYTIPKEEYRALVAENARLREGVRHLYICLTRPKAYNATVGRCLTCAIESGAECPYLTQGEHGPVCDWSQCGFDELIRELGIEVDE